jgi:hypothetical protein
MTQDVEVARAENWIAVFNNSAKIFGRDNDHYHANLMKVAVEYTKKYLALREVIAEVHETLIVNKEGN